MSVNHKKVITRSSCFFLCFLEWNLLRKRMMMKARTVVCWWNLRERMRSKSERPTCGSARFVYAPTMQQSVYELRWCLCWCHVNSSTKWRIDHLQICCRLLLSYRASSLRLTWKKMKRMSWDKLSGSWTNRKVDSLTFLSFIHSHVQTDLTGLDLF